MNSENSNIKRSITKTLLIIVGIIIALIMTMSSSLFTAENAPLNTKLYQPGAVTELQGDGGGSSEPDYNSGTRLLHFFTKNLPYLNHK